MTTTAIQTHVGIDNDMKVLLESLLGGGTAIDATARTAAATADDKAVAAQNDLDTTEGTVIIDLGVLRTAIIYCLTALDAQAAVINASGTNAVTTNVSGHTPAAITTV
jgi:hypothetical protein